MKFFQSSFEKTTCELCTMQRTNNHLDSCDESPLDLKLIDYAQRPRVQHPDAVLAPPAAVPLAAVVVTKSRVFWQCVVLRRVGTAKDES